MQPQSIPQRKSLPHTHTSNQSVYDMLWTPAPPRLLVHAPPPLSQGGLPPANSSGGGHKAGGGGGRCQKPRILPFMPQNSRRQNNLL